MTYFLSLLVLLLSPALWADVTVTTATKAKKPLLKVLISEQIKPGDYEALIAGLRAHPGRFKYKVAELNNIGGSLSEAMRIGRLLRQMGFSTTVPEQAICQGSCVYLLAAGVKRSAEGAVAIHRPSHAHGESHIAKSSAITDSTQSYWSYMGIAYELVSLMEQASPLQPRLLTATELKRVGLTNNRR